MCGGVYGPMLVPILCLTCGCPIGDKADLFRHLCAQLVQKTLKVRDIAPTQAAIAKDLQIDAEKILESLHIRHDCCRAHMVSAMVFSDYY